MKHISKLRNGAIAAILTAAVVAGTSAVCVFSAADGDPLVSLSYIDEVVIPNIKAYIDEKIDGLSVPAGSVSDNGAQSPDEYIPEEKSGEYEILALFRGQNVYALDTLEIILRSGEAAVISPFDSQGIGNMVNGDELLNGSVMPKNNYCIIPRGDGRGVSVESDECYIMVRGEYEIK